MFFDDWSGLVRTLIVGTLAYISLVAFLRISGKRTLSKLNAFDLVVTVALGSTLATILLSEDVALAEGLTAFALLIVLQYIISWSSIRSDKVESFVKSDPVLLFYHGKFLDHAMRVERVVASEVLAVLRQQGILDVGTVAAVVLETDGSISVVPHSESVDESSLRSAKRLESD